jgi:hypothetical protein
MAGLRAFDPINSSDRDLQLLQKELQNVLQPVTVCQLLTGVLKSVSFTAVDSDVLVPHGLGSLRVGWLAGSLSLPAIIFTSPSPQQQNQLILRCEQLAGVTAANKISSQNPLTAQVWAYLIG